MQEVLRAHGILEAQSPLFLQSLALSLNNPSSLAFLEAFASIFEISSIWLNGLTEEVTDRIYVQNAQHALIEFLVNAKRAGWEPKMLFIGEMNTSAEDNIILLIGLLKITKAGLSFTTYKHWGSRVWKEGLILSQKVGLYYQGIRLEASIFQALANHQVIPASALKNPEGVWFPTASSEEVEMHQFGEINKTLIEELCCTAVKPTCLHP
jgi:hypothetical protein